MSRDDKDVAPPQDIERALSDLTSSAPPDFGLGVLRRVGISPEKYDTYVRLDTEAGGLFVANSPTALTGSTLESAVGGPAGFEELHLSRTRRTAIPSTKPFPGLRPALRTGRAKNLPMDLTGLDDQQRAILGAVRSTPKGQLRPVSWLAREAGVVNDNDLIEQALARNPLTLLIPCHRITFDDGTPCDAACRTGTGQALRAAEGIDMHRLGKLYRDGAVYLGSATTHIYCHPTCAHARRITPRHQKPFRSVYEARKAGYRACRSCRPVTA